MKIDKSLSGHLNLCLFLKLLHAHLEEIRKKFLDFIGSLDLCF